MNLEKLRRLSGLLSAAYFRACWFVAGINYWKVLCWLVGICLALAGAAYVFLHPETEDARKKDKLDFVAIDAERTAQVLLQALEPCRKLGFERLYECSINNSPLPAEKAYALAASGAIRRHQAYTAACAETFSSEYCAELLNRAARNSVATGSAAR